MVRNETDLLLDGDAVGTREDGNLPLGAVTGVGAASRIIRWNVTRAIRVARTLRQVAHAGAKVLVGRLCPGRCCEIQRYVLRQGLVYRHQLRLGAGTAGEAACDR